MDLRQLVLVPELGAKAPRGEPVRGAVDVPLQRDCVLPISRGGRYTLSNMAPACGSCNASKCNQEVTSWLRRRRLDERAFLRRQIEVNAALALQFAGAGTPGGADEH